MLYLLYVSEHLLGLKSDHFGIEIQVLLLMIRLLGKLKSDHFGIEIRHML